MNVIFFGTPDFSVPTLQALISMPGCTVGAVVTQPDRPAGRGGKVTMSPVKQVALQHSIPVFQPTSLRREFSTIKSELDKQGPFDIGVVIAFGQILPKEVLSYPTHGCVNIHASLLPRWRGAAPIQRALQAGDTETGICLMAMDEGLDTGAVYRSVTLPILSSDTGGTLHDGLCKLGADALVKDLPAIVAGSLKAVPQPAEGVTYASKLTSEESRITWSSPAQEIELLIRAFSPWPGCYSMWRGKRLKIISASHTRRSIPANTTPGTILHAFGERFEIACGHGTSLTIAEVQLEGKKRMAVGEFLRGAAIPEGEVIGD
jgi:methionyl-tRNA formyltransferase